MEVHVDADYVRSIVDRGDTPRDIVFLGGHSVTLRSKIKNVVARLSAETKISVMLKAFVSCYG